MAVSDSPSLALSLSLFFTRMRVQIRSRALGPWSRIARMRFKSSRQERLRRKGNPFAPCCNGRSSAQPNERVKEQKWVASATAWALYYMSVRRESHGHPRRGLDPAATPRLSSKRKA